MKKIAAESEAYIKGRSANWLLGQIALGTSQGPGVSPQPCPPRNLTLEHKEGESESTTDLKSLSVKPDV